MYVSSKTRSFAVIFLFITLIYLYPSKVVITYGQISLLPDNSLIATTTDCITSMMTSTLIGSNADCIENLNKMNITSDINSLSKIDDANNSLSKIDDANNSLSKIDDANNSLSKNNPFYLEFQNLKTNNNTSSFPTSINSVDGSLANSGSSPSPLSPPPDNPPTSINSVDGSLANSGSSPSPILPSSPPGNELGNMLDKKNKNGKEIGDCFDRAFIPDFYLSDSEIIKCAEDHDSFSNNNNINSNSDDNKKNNDNKDNDSESDDERTKEIGDCFDRAFIPDFYLSDSEIIKCAEDHDSFK
ncbi:MAG: hypothetical protein H0X03_00030 [Nitrosopumilus sp.]|nr:hypothetical protein [Nitrosopumilus sp.]